MKTLLQLWLLLEWMNSSGVNFSWGKGKKRVDHIEKSICSKCLQTLSLYPIQLGIIFFPLLLRREDAILILCSPLLTEEDRGKKTSFFYSFRALTSSGYYQLDIFFFFFPNVLALCWVSENINSVSLKMELGMQDGARQGCTVKRRAPCPPPCAVLSFVVV